MQGNREVNRKLFDMRWDVIFFTGSPALGRQVMAAAARHLTPVVLELGGKSPCIVDRGADIDVAARRIAWGKTLNAGQTCIAPTTCLSTTRCRRLRQGLRPDALQRLHGDDARQSPHYVGWSTTGLSARNDGYLAQGKVLVGGAPTPPTAISSRRCSRRSTHAPVMQEEIFGPVLPMLTFERIGEAVEFVTGREKPLALYYFGPEAAGREVLRRTSSGRACLNDTIMHIANDQLPFGGVGNSGMGHYHGREFRGLLPPPGRRHHPEAFRPAVPLSAPQGGFGG